MYTAGINVYRYVDPALLSIDEFEIVKPEGHKLAIKGSNLVNDRATISLKLVNNTYCELSVYNTSGQRVQTIFQNRMIEGDHEIEWQLPQLAKGPYFLVLYTYHGYESIKVVVD